MFLLSNFIVLFGYLAFILVTYTFLKSAILNERTFRMAPEHAQLEFKVMNETKNVLKHTRRCSIKNLFTEN